MHEVCPGIFVIEERGLSKTLKPPVNVYIIPGPDGIIYDAGYGNYCSMISFRREFAHLRKYCKENGIQCGVNRIMISHAHPDHFAGMKKLSKRYKLKTVLTRRMADIIHDSSTYRESYRYDEPGFAIKSFPIRILKRLADIINGFLYNISWGIGFVPVPDIIINDNCDISINGETWKVIHSPGHSDDHISLYNPVKGVLLGGDNILRSKFTWLGPPKSDVDVYIKSLETIRDLPGLKLILTSHGSIVSDPAARINEIISYWANRMAQVGRCVRDAGQSGITVKGIIGQIYPASGRLKHEFVKGWIMLILDKMIRDGAVYAKNGTYTMKSFPWTA